MGGWGSGSFLRLSSKGTAESSLPLDIRKFKREGCLTPGRWFSWQWSTGGNIHSSIGTTVHEDYLLLQYTHKKTEDVKQRIYFEWTGCNYGGKRIWFSCPFCGRRCAVIYSCGKYFACRTCGNLTYKTSNETPTDRRASKANKLRKRIGAKPGAFNLLPIFKPKGMHQRTWDRIRFRIQSLEGLVFMEMDKKLDILRGKCNKIEKSFQK
jgi:hypothetical protein